MAALTQSRVLCASVIRKIYIILMFSSFFEGGLFRVFACTTLSGSSIETLIAFFFCFNVIPFASSHATVIAHLSFQYSRASL
jgi:hypothetical protein